MNNYIKLLSIGKRMFLACLVMVIAVIGLTANSYMISLKIKLATEQARAAGDQSAFLSHLKMSVSDLMAGAMRTIVNSDKGTADENTLDSVSKFTKFMADSAENFKNAGFSEQEQKSLESIQTHALRLVKLIRTDLSGHIGESRRRTEENNADIERITAKLMSDDTVIKNHFENILKSVSTELEETSKMASARNGQLMKLNEILRAYFKLYIAAKDSIINRSDGEVSEERMEIIETSVSFIKIQLDDLAALADNEAKKVCAEKIRTVFPLLGEAIQTRMPGLIERYASAEYFFDLDEKMNGYNSDIEENIETILEIVKKEHRTAADREQVLNRQTVLIKDAARTHTDLMLTVMSSEGEKNGEKRKQSIQAALTKVMSHMDAVMKLTESKDIIKTAEEIIEIYPTFIKAVEDDLLRLVGERDRIYHETETRLIGIVDSLNETGSRINDAMRMILDTANLRQKETSESLSAYVSKSMILILAISAISLSVLVPVFLSITASVTKPLNRLMNKLSDSAYQMADTAEQIAKNSQKLAENMSHQSAAAEETSESIEQMTDMCRQTADLSMDAERLMNQNIEKSGHSLKSIVQLTLEMSLIEADSGKMTQIIKTVDNIAFQTNILSLNASVEAARAGETGAGFAVVADEVRNLAGKVGQAAKSTQELLDATGTRVTEAMKSMKTINIDFESIIESATLMGEKSANISHANRKLLKWIDQIREATADIGEITHQVAAASEESASASEEMASQAEELKCFADELGFIVQGYSTLS